MKNPSYIQPEMICRQVEVDDGARVGFFFAVLLI